MGTASAQPVTPATAGTASPGFQAENAAGHDLDNRAGAVTPTARQRDLASADAVTVRWNRYGTPATVIPRTAAAMTTPGAVTPTAAPTAGGTDPLAVAHQYLAANQEMFGLSADAVNAMDVIADVPLGQGRLVMLRQRFGTLPSALDGLISLGISDDQVVYVTSTLSKDTGQPAPATLSAGDALAAAAMNAGLAPSDVATSRVRLAAVPTPTDGARSAYQVVLIGQNQADPIAYTSYVDARTGEILVRDNLVNTESSDPNTVDNPMWKAFPSTPPADDSSTDTRVTWCLHPAPGCERTVSDAASGNAWDIDQTTGLPSLTSAGNSEKATQKWDTNSSRAVGTVTATTSPTRSYTYDWTNQWNTSGCSPDVFTSPQQNDIDAALTNLFVTHNRMHDWAYHLGFTEATFNLQTVNDHPGGLGNDAEQGNAQAGGVVGGPPNFISRDNANQITPPDGVPPTTNMFLWQPVAGSFYAPCVDGDYDVSVIAHEYSHAISGRMIAGPDSGWRGFQGGSMNEATSDLMAMEYQFEYGFRPVGDTPFVEGGYVTDNAVQGIRDYDMSKSPLNYSDVGFDLVGPEVHADGEIWVATSFAVRQALVAKYGLGTPALQRACADGNVAVEHCPGNRRWIQLTYDALLLQASGNASMLDMRDDILAADQIRFGGADTALIWNAFAQRGMGENAVSDTNNDINPTPSFASPFAHNANLTLRPLGAARHAPVRLYVGDYEARAVPVADTDPATALGDTVQITPGRYHFIAAAPGFGSVRFTATVRSRQHGSFPVLMLPNLASASAGATASGDGVNLDKLVDDTESTDWASLGSDVAGKQVTVDLAGTKPVLVSRVQVSALLRPDIDDTADPGGQNRFTALRQFQVLSCDSAFGADCSSDAGYHVVYTSPANAFPAGKPRPVAPELTMRSFRIHPTLATHLRLRVLSNQCTGAPAYAGEQDNDPRAVSDCTTGNITVAQTVRVAEFEAFTL
ncbi:MAG TPA: M36 family metallopeptidase [Mycobacteriales bacterium]|nr:M36 family metallopeptidase [Mycobacteriales bacterium]